MIEDPAKIKQKIKDLKTATGEEWEEMDGNHALTGVVINPTGTSLFLPTSGLLLKAFYGKKTGEIKVFPAKMFEEDKGKDK